jgi:hypothetical protein
MHARLDRGAMKLLTRTGLDWTHKYPAIAKAVASLDALDGKLCGTGPDGITSFSIVRRFSGQASFMTALAGLTGFYMLVRLALWDHFVTVTYWWMHAIVAIWLLFTLLLFVAEPLYLHRWFTPLAKSRPQSTFGAIERLHRVILTLSLITLLGAVLGSHGALSSSAERTGPTLALPHD